MEFSADLDTYAFQCENILLAGDFNADIKQENLGAICTQHDSQQLNKKYTYLVKYFLHRLLFYFTFFLKTGVDSIFLIMGGPNSEIFLSHFRKLFKRGKSFVVPKIS